MNRITVPVAIMASSLFVATGLAHPALAASKAAQWIMSEQIAEGCGPGGGRFLTGGFAEHDLTGDGAADLIIDHGGIECADAAIGSRSGFCGAQACSVLIYVREGSLLKLATETLSIGFGIGAGKRPAISLTAHGGNAYTLRWDGKQFR